MELIHYGSSMLDRDKFKPICDNYMRTKPAGGLWTSPIDSKWGWKDWSDSEQWGDTSSHFKIEYHGNTFVVDSLKDSSRLPWIDDYTISFEALVALGYDAIHVTESGESETRYSGKFSLYGWDCETVLIFNQDCIRALI